MSKGVSDTLVPPKPSVLRILWTAIIILATILYLVLLLDLPSLPDFGNSRVLDAPITSELDNSTIGLAKKPVASTNSGLSVIEGIYVINLESRQDRYEQMVVLSSRLNLHWEWVSAVTATDRVINATLNWVRESRGKATMSNSKEDQIPDSLPTFTWPANIDSLAASDQYLDYWDPSDSPEFDDGSSPLQNSSDGVLPVTTQDYVLPVSTNSSSLQEYMLLTPGRIACWHSHLNLIHRIANSNSHDPLEKLDSAGQDVSAPTSPSLAPISVDASTTQRAAWLILEDDVDMERDIDAQLSRLWTYLPNEWDIVFLGKSCSES